VTGAATVRVWRERRFRRYWAGQTVSEVGDRVSELALPLTAVLVLDAGPFAVGALTAAVWTPHLLSLFVGAWVDARPRKRPLLVAANLVQAIAVLSIPVAAAIGALSMPVLYAAALVGGAGGVLAHTAYPPFFVRLVDRDQYVEANSLLSTTRSASFLVGPPLAGGLIKAVGAPTALLVDCCSFLVAALMIGRVDVDERPRATEEPDSFVKRLGVGVRYLRHHPYLRITLACSTTLNIAGLALQAILILYAARVLGLGPGTLGLALGMGAVGGLVGALVAAAVARALGTGPTIAVGATLFTAPFALLPLTKGTSLTLRVAILAAAYLVSGLAIMLYDINNNSLQAAVTDDRMRSRVSGAYSTVNYGIRPVAALLGGVAAEHLGVTTTVVAAGAVGSLAALWLVGSPVLSTRRISDLEPRAANRS
jgi:predicted MFS family arabinose efflux permease